MKKLTILTLIALLLSLISFGTTTENLNNTFWSASFADGTKIILELKLKNNKIFLHSRKGSSKDIIGGKFFLGRVLGKVNPHAIEIEGNYTISYDTVFFEGKYESLTSRQNLSGKIYNNELRIKLAKNSIIGNRVETAIPIRDYYQIAKDAIDTTENYLYNPAILESKEWIAFKSKMLELSKVVWDDYEFSKLYNYSGSQLPFSHYGLILDEPVVQKTKNQRHSNAKPKETKFEIEKINTETVLFKVKTFSASAEEIKPYLDTLKTIEPENLIIDLRDNRGGTIASALPLAEYLVKDTLYGGIFLTQKYFSNHSEIPKPENYRNFTLFSEASFALIIEGIHSQEGLCLVVNPGEQTYTGNLFILTDKMTASTCEPLVYGLKSAGRATIIGETTAGAMLNGEKFKLSEVASLWMPTADYYAHDGFKIDKVGVKPDVKVKRELALKKALEIIKE